MRARLLTILVGAPLVLGAVFCTHPLPFALVLAITAVFGLQEYVWLRRGRRLPLLGLALMGATPFLAAPGGSFALFAFHAVCFLLGVFVSTRVSWSGRLADELGGLWITAPLAIGFLLHQGDSAAWAFDFRVPFLMAILPIWFGDSAAIVVGRAVGRHLLAPQLSPKKTIEGAVGHFVFSILGAAIVGRILGMPAVQWALCGALISVFGQIGDLFESWLKRVAGRKDSGDLLPGHGGFLDRIDGLVFVIPIVGLLLAAWGWTR